MSDTEPLVPRLREERDLGLCKRGRWVIIPILVFYFYAAGIDMYVQPEYTQDRMKQELNASETFSACHANKSDVEYERFKDVQRKSAQWVIYFNIASLTPAVFVSLILGPLTDVLGRKFLLTLATFGFAAKMAVWCFVIHYDLSLAFVLIGQFLNGITGSMFAVFVVVFSFVADVTAVGPSRTLAIVLSELLFGVVITVSSFVSGYFIKSVGFFYPEVVATGLAAISTILSLIAYPETRRAVRRPDGTSRLGHLKKSLKEISILNSAKRSLQFYFSADNKIVRLQYVLLMGGFMFMIMSSLSRLSLEALYQLGSPFCWSPLKVGWFGTMRLGGATLIGLGALKLMKCCLADDTIAIIGGLTGLISFVFEAFAKTDIELYIVAGITVTSFLPIPMIRSILSHLTPADQQGAMFAGVGAMETLCTLLGALTTNAVYSATLSIMNGFVFLVLAGLSAISLICLVVLFIVRRKYPDHTTLVDVLVIEETIAAP